MQNSINNESIDDDVMATNSENKIKEELSQNSENFIKNESDKELIISKKYEKIIKNYILNEDKSLTNSINKYFHLEDFSNDILRKEFKPKKSISNFIFNKYHKIINDKELNNISKLDCNSINIYILEYIFPYIEILFIDLINNYLKINSKNFNGIISPSTESGFFESIVIYNILSNRKLYDININNYICLYTIIPKGYSIKLFSFRQKLKRIQKGKKDLIEYDFEKLLGYGDDAQDKLIDLENEVLFLKLENSNTKYYDFGIFIPTDDFPLEEGRKNFYLLLGQISTKKEKNKRLTKEEHEINFYFIKHNLESKYKIRIKGGFFYYILKSVEGKIEDNETFRENSSICLGFDILEGFNKKKEFSLINDRALITKKFPFFNSAILLKNNLNLTAYNKINSLLNNEIEQIDEDVFSLLKKYIRNKNQRNLEKKQFHLIGKKNMNDSIKSLTDFFIYYNSNNHSININNQKKILNELIKGENFCICSNYQVEFINN